MFWELALLIYNATEEVVCLLCQKLNEALSIVLINKFVSLFPLIIELGQQIGRGA
jgi:hypothetical protein